MKRPGRSPGLFFALGKRIAVKQIEIYHIVFETDVSAWKVEKEGSTRPITRTEGKDAAIRAAKSLARSAPQGEVIIHRKDGAIQEVCSYGSDPGNGLG
jgi:hypothetical protein